MITTKKRNDNPLNVFEDVFGTLFNDSVGALAKAAQTHLQPIWRCDVGDSRMRQ